MAHSWVYIHIEHIARAPYIHHDLVNCSRRHEATSVSVLMPDIRGTHVGTVFESRQRMRIIPSCRSMEGEPPGKTSVTFTVKSVSVALLETHNTYFYTHEYINVRK